MKDFFSRWALGPMLILLVLGLALQSCDRDPEPEEEEPRDPWPEFYFGTKKKVVDTIQTVITDVQFGENVNGYIAAPGFYSFNNNGVFEYHHFGYFIKSGDLDALFKDFQDFNPSGEFVFVEFVGRSENELSASSVNSIIYPNRYSYSKVDPISGALTPGVLISYRQGDKTWRTDLGNQFNSSFVVEVTKDLEVEFNLEDITTFWDRQVFFAEFNCTLYDEEGNFIEFNEGFVRAPTLKVTEGDL